ncbi:MAG TPA: hypothetical protein DCZ94_19515 [Lentisphaeria bacterium]|nr:MAG: hypothetical protein A2X48_23810 [Lentisphaerae bacterium GWF2_49_21]HBC89133.1 hypothetical protein [Lentisphaeria bacterium]
MKTIIITTSLALLISMEAYCLPESQPADGMTTVKDSKISAETEGSLNAINQSRINAGVNARNSEIRDSEISSRTKADVKAVNFSDVNTGVRIDDANVLNSKIQTNTEAKKIEANNSQISTGVNVTGAVNSDIRTNVAADNITARDSIVNIGTVKGDVSNKKITTDVNVGNVDAVKEQINIGNVTIDDKIGSKSKVFTRQPNIDPPSPGADDLTRIGNVTIESGRVKEVNVKVGDSGISGMGDKIRERNQARVFSKDEGVDPSGTKHVYVDDRERRDAERDKEDVGNVTIDKGSKVKKVNVYVDE